MESKRINRLLDGVIYLLLIIFLSSSGFSDMPPPSGWYQQNMTNWLNNINSLVFTDSLTGYIATASDQAGHNYILKTTNGGENWFELLYQYNIAGFRSMKFINKDTGFVLGLDYLYITKNAGVNWYTKYIPAIPSDMYPLNVDTIFCVDEQSIIGGFYRTTDGGTSWTKLINFGSGNPTRVYFYDKNNGFIVRWNELHKTTNGGYNWFGIPTGGRFDDICFIDSLIGYKTYVSIKKTTDGGLNWTVQQLPQTFGTSATTISAINKDTVWSTGGVLSSNGYKGIVYITTNGGENWGFQIPLVNSTNSSQYKYIYFINSKNGWAYLNYAYLDTIRGVHTTTGGSDTTIYTSVNNNISILNRNYELFQNYPNPFNSITNVKFKMLNSGFAKIKIYDITGKMVRVLTSKKYEAGEHIVRFDASELPSGVYFYRLLIDEGREYRETRKLILIK